MSRFAQSKTCGTCKWGAAAVAGDGTPIYTDMRANLICQRPIIVSRFLFFRAVEPCDVHVAHYYSCDHYKERPDE